MEAVVVSAQSEPLHEIIRDGRGVAVGVIERQHLVGRLIARDKRGIVVGIYDERSRETRNAHGRLVGKTNLLPALLLLGR